ncbi:TlpA family protein disulfide reductase [Roseivirga pacifica]
MKHTSFLFLCLIILGCSKESTKEKLPEEKPNQVVLIFRNPKNNGVYEIPGTDGQTVRNLYAMRGLPIEAIDEQNLVKYYGFNETKEYDTLIIPTKRDMLELKFAYKAIDRLTYYFQNGDTVFIEYKDIKPYATILNRNEAFEVTNYQLLRRDSLLKVDFPALDKYAKYSFTLNEWSRETKRTGDRIDLKEFQKKFKAQQVEKILAEYTKDKLYLDNLERQGLISVLHKTAIFNDFYWLLKNEIQLEVSKTPENSQKLIQLLKKLEEEHPNINIRSDSLLASINYQKHIRGIASKEFKPEWMEIKSDQAGSRITNYISMYDSVRNSNLFSASEKLILQYAYVDQILQNPSFFNIEERLIYLTRFKNDFNDTTLFNTLVKKYNVKFEIDDEVLLTDKMGVEKALRTVISESQGKVVYVDFWASWCAPCIKEMPSSQSLQKTLADQNIEFIYLSTDRKEKPWSEAIAKHQLNTGLHYRITNADNSKTMEELAVQFIPRYMIFDKNGKLVNNDAPRPSEQEKLIQEFNRYLGQQ